MSLANRQRRRRGARASMRRGLYGLLLWACAPHPAKAQAAERPPSPIKVNVSIEALRDVAGEQAAVYRIGFAADDPRLSGALNSVAGLLRLRHREVVERVRGMGQSLGIDIELPDDRMLHLMLHPRKDEPVARSQWTTSAPDWSRQEPTWSLGTAVDVISVQRYNRISQDLEPKRQVEVVPQLVVDADRLLGLKGQAVMTLEQACWKSVAGIRDESVIQLRLKWHF